MSNTFMKFIDSCVGAIARKVQDEFDESKHPRDKGGRFSSKGGEGRGGASKKGNVITTSMEFTGDEEDAKQLAKKYGFEYKLKYPKGSPYATIEITGDKDALRKYAVNEGFGSEEDAREFVPELFEESEDDDEGYMGMSKEELAEEEEYENARERARREKDDDRVTGPEDRDYMNEEDDDEEEIKAGKETDKIVEEFEGSGIDMYSAMADLGLDVYRIPESHLAGVFKEKLFNSPKFRRKAKQYISEYRGIDPDEEEGWFK